MRRQEVVLPFAPRPWQRPLLADQAKRIVAVVHRRAGKSTGLMWKGIACALTTLRRTPPPRAVHVLPYMVQWDRTGLWDQVKDAAAGIPGAQLRQVERRIVLPNGGVYQAGGLDKPEGWRGGYADMIIVDEYDDTMAQNLTAVIEPMLADHDGTLIRSGTPKGKGQLKEAYEEAATKAGHSRYLLPFWETKVLSDTAIARMRAEMSPEEFQQEFECSWDAPRSGSYYGKLLHEAQHAGRITRVPHEPRLPVWTAWDLGLDDATAIWFIQQAPGGEVRVIGYYEASDEALPHYAKHILARNYLHGGGAFHLLPHDAEVRDMATKISREATLNSLGIKPTRIVSRGNVADGINAVRMLLPRMWFDEVETKAGRDALAGYAREWNQRMGTWRAEPKHDWASHGADAMRTFAEGHRPPRGDRRGVVVESHHDPHAR
jgi:phage terminase large subunit